jgi:hypothetical protein
MIPFLAKHVGAAALAAIACSECCGRGVALPASE